MPTRFGRVNALVAVFRGPGSITTVMPKRLPFSFSVTPLPKDSSAISSSFGFQFLAINVLFGLEPFLIRTAARALCESATIAPNDRRPLVCRLQRSLALKQDTSNNASMLDYRIWNNYLSLFLWVYAAHRAEGIHDDRKLRIVGEDFRE